MRKLILCVVFMVVGCVEPDRPTESSVEAGLIRCQRTDDGGTLECCTGNCCSYSDGSYWCVIPGGLSAEEPTGREPEEPVWPEDDWFKQDDPCLDPDACYPGDEEAKIEAAAAFAEFLPADYGTPPDAALPVFKCWATGSYRTGVGNVCCLWWRWADGSTSAFACAGTHASGRPWRQGCYARWRGATRDEMCY